MVLCEVRRSHWPGIGLQQRAQGRYSYEGHRSRTLLCPKAQTLDRRLVSGNQQHGETRERILRYPNGQERRIRYPSPPSDEEGLVISTSSDTSYKDWWGTEVYYETGARAMTEASASTSGRSAASSGRLASISGRTQEQERVPEIPQPPTAEPQPDGLPSSPAELLRYISSKPYKAAQAEQQRLVHSSYKILDGSPWVRTRQVYVLATAQQGSEAGMTYTMRTRIARTDAEDEVTKVLGRRRGDGSSLIKVEELRDGIVTFEDMADAQRFAEQAEAEGVQEVMVAECDAHELFRQARSVRAVVVLLPAGGYLPQPEQLGSALRGQRSLEDYC